MIPKASVRLVPNGTTIEMSIFAQALETRADELAQKVAQYARENCPEKSGKLKKSIKVEDMPDGKRVRAAANHAHLVELGHRMVKPYHIEGGGQEAGHVPAYPFLRPALDKVIAEETTAAMFGSFGWQG